MPAIVDPHRAQSYGARFGSSLDAGSHRRASSLRLWVRVTVQRAKLTRALAEGMDPLSTDELALRARQLTSERTRRTFARSLRRAIVDAHQRPRTRSAVSIIDRRAVLDAEAAIVEMSERLLSPRPVSAEGMAMLERILTNADGSPLYNRSARGALERTIRVATAALDRSRSHEFVLAA